MIFLAIGFTALCGLIGFSAALAFSLPATPWLAAGLLAGATPLWLPRLWPRMPVALCAEKTSLVMLVALGLGVSAYTLSRLLAGELPRVQDAAPLFLLSAALYGVYLILHRFHNSTRAASVPDHLTAIFSGSSTVVTLTMGVFLGTYALLLMHYAGLNNSDWAYLTDKFLKRGIIPPVTLMLFFWGLLTLVTKALILWQEKRLIERPGNRVAILERALQQQMESGGANAREDFLEILWKKSADSYTFSRYISWAMPILGFIGTVLGISLVADGIQDIFSRQGNISQVSSDLGEAMAPLGIAFDTTLVALTLSVALVLLQTALQRWEDNVLMAYENLLRGRESGGGGHRAHTGDDRAEAPGHHDWDNLEGVPSPPLDHWRAGRGRDDEE